MGKTIETLGFAELTHDLAEMASRLSDAAGSGAIIEAILNAAAQPVLEAAQRNAPKRTGKLHEAIKVGKVKKRAGGGYTIKIGSHKGDDAYYASWVEFGHGGPKPAAPHPFMRPAYDTTKDQAYAIIRARLEQEITKHGG